MSPAGNQPEEGTVGRPWPPAWAPAPRTSSPVGQRLCPQAEQVAFTPGPAQNTRPVCSPPSLVLAGVPVLRQPAGPALLWRPGLQTRSGAPAPPAPRPESSALGGRTCRSCPWGRRGPDPAFPSCWGDRVESRCPPSSQMTRHAVNPQATPTLAVPGAAGRSAPARQSTWGPTVLLRQAWPEPLQAQEVTEGR